MKGISGKNHNALLKKTESIQQAYMSLHNKPTPELSEMSRQLRKLYREHQSILDVLTKNITDYNKQYNALRKVCQSKIKIIQIKSQKDEKL
ncbi:MAG: hypothetical protein WBI53_06370 [Paludibacter sp.]